MERFIIGDKFKTLADWVYASEIKSSDDYDNLVGTLNLYEVKDGDIIYTHTFYAKQLFDVIKGLDKKFIVITHNGDNTVDDSYEVPDNVAKWYAIMIDTVNPKIVGIPVGVSNDRWFPWLNKKEIILKQWEQPRNYRNLVYMNFDIRTNPAKRTPVYYQFKDKPWVTMKMGINTEDYPNYTDNIYNHKFMLCPDGNGLGSHRTWETLYLGSIPIEIKNKNSRFFDDLPILFVDSWEEVTQDFLDKSWEEMQKVKWNLGKLNFSYWENKIRNGS